MRRRWIRQSGFTLVEALVVIGIIGVIVGLIMPALASVKAESHSTSCLSNLRQLYVAIQTYRAQSDDLLPYTQALPAATPIGPLGGLPSAIGHIVPRDAETWFCPADTAEETLQVGTSYLYTAGAFMTAEFDPALTQKKNAARAARLVTQRFDKGYLHRLPILADAGDYHDHGNRQPWNGIFINGEARPLRLDDDNVMGQ